MLLRILYGDAGQVPRWMTDNRSSWGVTQVRRGSTANGMLFRAKKPKLLPAMIARYHSALFYMRCDTKRPRMGGKDEIRSL